MPIVVRYDSPGTAIGLAASAGRAQGQARGGEIQGQAIQHVAGAFMQAGLEDFLAQRKLQRALDLEKTRRAEYETEAAKGPEAAAAWVIKDQVGRGQEPDEKLMYQARGQLTPDQQRQQQESAERINLARAHEQYYGAQAREKDAKTKAAEQDQRDRAAEFDRMIGEAGHKGGLVQAMARREYVHSGKLPEWMAGELGVKSGGAGAKVSPAEQLYQRTVRQGGVGDVYRASRAGNPMNVGPDGKPVLSREAMAAGNAIGAVLTDPTTSLETIQEYEKQLEAVAADSGQPLSPAIRGEIETQKAIRLRERDIVIEGVHEQVQQATARAVDMAVRKEAGKGGFSALLGMGKKAEPKGGPSPNTRLALEVGSIVERLCKVNGITVDQYREWKRRQSAALDRSAAGVNASALLMEQLAPQRPGGGAGPAPEAPGHDEDGDLDPQLDDAGHNEDDETPPEEE
jgi:hypothetical protein